MILVCFGLLKRWHSKRPELQLRALPNSSTRLAPPPSPSQVKNVDIEAMPRGEEKELFKDFMEEFNTASLPHK